MELSNSLKIKIVIGIVLVILSGLVLIFYNSNDNLEDDTISFEELEVTTITTEKIKDIFHVDIKGAVKKPGVYEMEVGSIIQDVINKAGGLKTSAYTKNINLAQVVKDEMVIYIFTKSEIKKSTTTPIVTDTTCECEVIEVNNCITEATTTSSKKEEEDSPSNSLVNINTATMEELMTVSGIGESKAKAIIEYRETNSFKTIEDIKNVSGIGDSLFAKIKDYITV